MARLPLTVRSSLGPKLALALLIFLSLAHSQTAPPQDHDGWGRPVTAPKVQKSGPAPRRDISGTWDPGDAGIGQLGAKAMPEDGRPEHRPPYTPAGQEALNQAKPSNGIRAVLPGETNDPVVTCDPQGMPREDLYEMRATQIVQTPLKIMIMYTFGKIWSFPKTRSPDGTGIRWANGWMTIRWSSRP